MHFLQRHKLWFLLVLLLGLNLVIFWPKKKAIGEFPPGSPGQTADGRPPEPDEKMKAKFEEMLSKMTPEQRQAFEERRKTDEAFFDSLKSLSEDERRKKMDEYRAKNPPPAMPDGMKPPGPPPTAGNKGNDSSAGNGGNGSGGGNGGGPGGNGSQDGSSTHVPSPSMRRSLDQQIVNSQNGASQ
jgi:hypothetical protein